MRKLVALGMIGFLAGLIGLAPDSAGAGWGRDDAQTTIAQRPKREKLRERRKAIRLDADEWRAAWQGLSPEDQATLTKAWSDATERVKGLTPEQKQQLRQAANQMAESLKNLSPEQKERLQQQLDQSAQAYAALTAEQKQALLAQMSDYIDRMGKLSTAQKAQLKASYKKLLGQ
jgi:TRAP-type C4-dicarboxylate transport system substrate-binding protein